MEEDSPAYQTSEPVYIVTTHKSGGVRIVKHPNPNAGGLNLFTLDQLAAILQERLADGKAVVVGGAA